MQVKSNEKKWAREKEKLYKKIKFADGRIAHVLWLLRGQVLH